MSRKLLMDVLAKVITQENAAETVAARKYWRYHKDRLLFNATRIGWMS